MEVHLHPDRLSFLKYNHAPQKRIVSRNVRCDRVDFILECGHTGSGAPHFDYSQTQTWKCTPCAEAIVRKLYANEFTT